MTVKPSSLSNQKGMAMIIAIFSLMLLIFIATEVSYETQVEYASASQEVNRLKAYYAAKAGVEISLLRVLLYKKALASLGTALPDEQKSMLDPIWNFPFAWPPLIPDDLAVAEKDQIQKVIKESSMKSSLLATIESEGGFIDINDLGSPAKSLRKQTHKQILQIFTNRVENDSDFSEKHSGFNFEELVNNLQDWVDEDKESLNGGDESAIYEGELANSEFIPPNKAFKTLREIQMVKNMTDEFFYMLKDKITIYGSKGINVNYAPAEVIMALDVQLTKEMAEKIVARRQDKEKGGLFTKESFEEYLESGELNIDVADFNKDGIPLLFKQELNFRIKSTGNFAKSIREITAVVYDMDNLAERLIELLDQQDKTNDQEQDGNNPDTKDPEKKDGSDANNSKNKDNNKKTTIKVPKGRPTIVYWDDV